VPRDRPSRRTAWRTSINWDWPGTRLSRSGRSHPEPHGPEQLRSHVHVNESSCKSAPVMRGCPSGPDPLSPAMGFAANMCGQSYDGTGHYPRCRAFPSWAATAPDRHRSDPEWSSGLSSRAGPVDGSVAVRRHQLAEHDRKAQRRPHMTPPMARYTRWKTPAR
jgi:hypothetical protein